MAMQKPTAKKQAATKGVQQQASELAGEWKAWALSLVKQLDRFKDIIENNYALGQSHLLRGNLQDAVLRFRFVLWLDAKYKQASYFLGCSYLAQGDVRRAREALLKALKQDPANDDARYMLAIAMGESMPKGELPRTIPAHILREQFEAMAHNFNASQLDEMQYTGHTLLCNGIRSSLVPGRVDHVILDLGVGTGLCGPLLRDVASHITGVDIAPAMLAEAMQVVDDRGKKTYDALLNREAIEFITDGPDAGYDIVMAAGLVGYIGDLQPWYEHCARLLKVGGIFGFTADLMDGGSYQFDPVIGRFRYSMPYLGDLAARFHLTEIRCREAKVYPESAGLLCVYRK